MPTISKQIGHGEELNAVQLAIFEWGRHVLGHDEMSPQRRALRLVEEAMELAQVEGVPLHTIVAQAEHTYSRPVGERAKEAGGVFVTLLAYCESVTMSAAYLLNKELERINSKPLADFRTRTAEKLKAGLL